MDSPEYLRRDQAAEYLQSRYGTYTSATLKRMASIGGGPTFRKAGKFPLYLKSDLDEWMAARMSGPVANTAQVRAAKPH